MFKALLLPLLVITLNPDFDLSQYASTSELSAGMLLESKTRMQQNEMKHFGLIVLSVLKNSRPQEDSVLAEITNREFVETGVLAGMSGSPVYLSNRLVGAISYTTTFQKKPIVGITPIRSMLEVINHQKINRSAPYDDGKKFYGFTPIRTPLAICGKMQLSDETIRLIFDESSYFIIAGGSSFEKSSNVQDAKPFLPGDACAVGLVRGDLSIMAFGTVTHVKDNYVLAFGHPLSSSGLSSTALYSARIDAVVPLLSLSYKIGSMGAEVGTIVQDRSSAILGELGAFSSFVPLRVSVKSEIQERKFNYEVTSDPAYFSRLSAMIFTQSFLQHESTGEETTLYYTLNVRTDYHNRNISITDCAVNPRSDDACKEINNTFENIFRYIHYNPFLPIKILSADLALHSVSSIKFLEITGFSTDSKVYRPGSTVSLSIHTRGYKTGKSTITETFTLPENIRTGLHQIIVSSGYFYLINDMQINPDKYIPSVPEDIFNILDNKINTQSLMIWMYADTDSLVINGTEYQSLPLFHREVILQGRRSYLEPTHRFFLKSVVQSVPVIGAHGMIIEITDRNTQ